ncbi:MAG TPA: MlaD family protein [Candidatus Paceibacterota bacterium]|nr:MlaD family protein [Candidatus Paceibacterota bacterium]
MALQDLTPQLRTRLSRMERAVGWFVIIATALLLFGFGYYIYNMAQRKGWFTPKFLYQTGLNNVAGIKVGDPVRLMGNTVGQITEMIPNDPKDYYGMTVRFSVLKPHYGYIWDDSKVKVGSDFIGNRYLEITKGEAGVPTILEDTNKVAQGLLRKDSTKDPRLKQLAELHGANPDLERTNSLKFYALLAYQLNQLVEQNPTVFYTNLTEICWLYPEESPALNERLERVANQIEEALPNILNLTNQIYAVLSNSTILTAHLDEVAVSARPAVSNLALVTAQLNQPGALGEWLLPTNINQKLDSVLGGADSTLNTANTNLAALAQSLYASLENLSTITSNLNGQMQANTNLLSGISKAIVDADNLVQGLKHHWLLRSAFKKENAAEKNAPEKNAPEKSASGYTQPVQSPKESGKR